jgi:hypothetical protein
MKYSQARRRYPRLSVLLSRYEARTGEPADKVWARWFSAFASTHEYAYSPAAAVADATAVALIDVLRGGPDGGDP